MKCILKLLFSYMKINTTTFMFYLKGGEEDDSDYNMFVEGSIMNGLCFRKGKMMANVEIADLRFVGVISC